MKKILNILMIIIILFTAGITVKCSGGKNTVIIASKNFTESDILGEIMAQLIEKHTNLEVKRKFNLGGTMICYNALKNNDINIYAEYTGTGLVSILKQKAVKSAQKAYEIVKNKFKEKFNIIWLKQFGFNNTYTLTMRRKDAKERNIIKISDLVQYKDSITSGFTAEFIQRTDGYPGLIKHYGFEFANSPKVLDPGLMYKALKEKSVDVICGFATDGRIKAYDLFMLEDDKNFFPPYYAAPVISEITLKKYPKLKEVLNKLNNLISDETMQKLNYSVDKQGKTAKEAAREFLKSKGLI